MKKLLLCLNIILFGIPLVHADTPLKISAPPSIWVHQQGEALKGPIIDLLEGIFAEQHIAITAKALPWARAIAYMKSGQLDIIPVIFHTDERAGFMDFSLPYTDVPTVVCVSRSKAFPFATLDDLKNRSGLMIRGDSISSEFKAFESNLNITRLVRYEQLLVMLCNDRADYAVAPKYGLLAEAMKSGYHNKIEILPTPIASRTLHIAFSKKSPFLKYLPVLNEKLEKMRANGALEKMVDETIRLSAGKGR